MIFRGAGTQIVLQKQGSPFPVSSPNGQGIAQIRFKLLFNISFLYLRKIKIVPRIVVVSFFFQGKEILGNFTLHQITHCFWDMHLCGYKFCK